MGPDYEKMYYIMMNATEKAMNIIIDAQRVCEEIYVSAPDRMPQIIQINKNEKDK